MTDEQRSEFEKMFKKSRMTRMVAVSIGFLSLPIMLGVFAKDLSFWFLVVLFIHIGFGIVYYYGFSDFYPSKCEEVKEKNLANYKAWIERSKNRGVS